MKRLMLIVVTVAAMAVGSIAMGRPAQPATVIDGTGRQCLMRCETTCTVQASVAANAAQLMGADGDQVFQSIYQSCMSVCPCTLVGTDQGPGGIAGQ